MFKIFILLTSIIFLSFSHALKAELIIGDEVEIQGEKYKVISELGKGGFKRVFKVEKINCTTISCIYALAYPQNINSYSKFYHKDNLDVIYNSDAVNVRKETPLLKARVKGFKDEFYVSMMEYGQTNINRMTGQLANSYQAMRLIYEDALDGVKQLDDLGLVNTDMKLDNLILLGSGRSNKDILEHRAIATIADHDSTLKIGQVIQGRDRFIYTIGLTSPEQARMGAVIDSKSSLWQLALEFYYLITGETAIGQFEYQELAHLTLEDIRHHPEKLTRYQLIMDRIAQRIDIVIDETVRETDKEALKDMKKMILEGFKLDPQDRAFWPEGLEHLRPKEEVLKISKYLPSNYKGHEIESAMMSSHTRWLHELDLPHKRMPNCSDDLMFSIPINQAQAQLNQL